MEFSFFMYYVGDGTLNEVKNEKQISYARWLAWQSYPKMKNVKYSALWD